MVRRSAVELERRNLLEHAPVATALLVGPDHLFELANPLYRQMVGRPDLVGKTYLEAFPELKGTQLPAVLDQVYATGEPFATSEQLVAIDRGEGKTEDCYFRFNLEPVRDQHGQVYGMMAVAVEVTEQVVSRLILEKAYAERERLLQDVEKASRAKDEFLAMLGHELRNPLSPILTALELMRLKSGGETSREQDIIQRQARHLIRLVDDLLDVAKIARGKVELRRAVVDLYDVVMDAAETASHELEHALHAGESPVRMFTLVGGLTGAATGFAFPTWASMDWPLITGGKPIISGPAWVIIAFELTILFGALSTVAGLFINARLPQRRIMQVYDPSFSSDRFGILVMPPSGREAEVRDIMRDNGAAEIREQVQEVKVGDL